MTLFGHISDPHIDEREQVFQARGPRTPKDTRAKKLRRILSRMSKLDAGIIPLITGDLTESCREWELEQCRKILHGYDAEVTPGNHDCGGGGVWFLQSRYRDFHDALVPGVNEDSYPRVRDFPDCRLIILDSCHSMGIIRWALARGRVGREQMNRLRMLLETDRPCIVMLHHHPTYRGFGLELVDSDLLDATVQASSQPVLVLCGHKHHESTWRQGRVLYHASGRCTDDMTYARIRVKRAADLSAFDIEIVRVPPLELVA
jgi:3',5'-cyclic AMP phosphodiesterase CpdA